MTLLTDSVCRINEMVPF